MYIKCIYTMASLCNTNDHEPNHFQGYCRKLCWHTVRQCQRSKGVLRATLNRQPHVSHKILKPLCSPSICDRRRARLLHWGERWSNIHPSTTLHTCGHLWRRRCVHFWGASDLKGIGLLASQVAAVVVGQQGTRLRVQDADRLAECFAHHLDSLEFCSDVWIWRCKHLIVSGLVQTLDIYMYIQSLPFLVGLVHLFNAGNRAEAGKGLSAHLVSLTIIAHNWN